jgi:hypothetical protein
MRERYLQYFRNRNRNNMIDVFTEQIEVLIKDGISNLYWFKGDLKKLWYRVGVPIELTNKIFNIRLADRNLSKREALDKLYEELRNYEYNKRLEISRNFVRTLVEHTNFVPQAAEHRIEKAETAALKLKTIVNEQKKEQEYRDKIKHRAKEASTRNYQSELMNIREQFLEVEKIEVPQKRGIEFEKFFTNLMKANGIPVEEGFRIVGEQIDGAIKHDGHFYLVELKWQKEKSNQKEIASLFMKVEGKLEARGMFISMEGFSKECIESLPKGKNLKVILLDGVHMSNVIFGNYSFSELLEHSISQASLKGEIYCNHNITIK